MSTPAFAFAVMASGGSRVRAFWYTSVASGGEVLGAVVALVFAETLTETRIAALLALVAGLMITLSAIEITPSALTMLRRRGEGVAQRPKAGARPMP